MLTYASSCLDKLAKINNKILRILLNQPILYCSCVFLLLLCFLCFHCYCIDVFIDVRLSHLNKDYLLTYLLTYTDSCFIVV